MMLRANITIYYIFFILSKIYELPSLDGHQEENIYALYPF